MDVDNAITRLVNEASIEDMLGMMNGLDETYRGLGMHHKALELGESTLALHRRILPKDHRDIALSMSNLAVTYGDLGMHGKALEMKESALAMRMRILPEDHLDIAASMSILAVTYCKLGMHDRGCKNFRQH